MDWTTMTNGGSGFDWENMSPTSTPYDFSNSGVDYTPNLNGGSSFNWSGLLNGLGSAASKMGGQSGQGQQGQHGQPSSSAFPGLWGSQAAPLQPSQVYTPPPYPVAGQGSSPLMQASLGRVLAGMGSLGIMGGSGVPGANPMAAVLAAYGGGI